MRIKFWLLALSLLWIDTSYAFVDFSHDHFIRFRYESRRDYNFNDAHQSYFLSLIRSRFQWKWNERTYVVVSAQDARLFDGDPDGFPRVNRDRTPNSLEDRTDLHEAFVSLPLSQDYGQIMIGRQRIGYGQGRYLTSPGWRNVSLAFDGLRMRFGQQNKRFLDVIALRPAAVRPADFNDWAPTGNPTFDSKIYGLWFADQTTSTQHHWESHLLVRDNDDNDDAVISLMGRWKWNPRKGLNVQAEIAQQDGEFAGEDHQATAIGVRAQYQTKPWFVSVYADYASGDSDPSDGKHETFENLYPANHGRYGLMDFFSLQNMLHGGFSLRRDIAGGWQLRVDGMSFWLDQEDTDAWYNSGKGAFRQAAMRDVDAHVGDEIDLVARWRGKVLQRWSGDLEIGYGRFIAGDYIKETSNATTDATFVWTQLGLRY